MSNCAYFLLFCCFWCFLRVDAALVMFSLDSSGADVDGIRNCSCFIGSPTCSSTALLNSPFCTCVLSTVDAIASSAGRAKASNTVSWWNADVMEPLTICCESTSTAAASQLLNNLIDFSYTSRLTLHHCEGLVPSTEMHFTIYGLQEVSIQTVTNANNPTQFISMTDTDHALTNKRSREFRDFHIAFVDKSLLDGNLEMKSWSVWVFPEDVNSEFLQAAIDRAPSSVLSKSDGIIMFTPIYD